MKRRILKTITTAVSILLVILTATDIYIRAKGDISAAPISHKLEEITEAIGESIPAPSDGITIFSYNLLSDSAGYEGSNATNRSKGVLKIFEELKPDIIGVQEMSRRWYCILTTNTPYKTIHPIRTFIFENMTGILYNPLTTELLFSGEAVYSNGGDSRLRRMVYGIFMHKSTNRLFGVVNTHLNLPDKSNDSIIAQTQAMELTEKCRDIQEIYNCPIIITGDFNTSKKDIVYTLLTSTFDDTGKTAEKIFRDKTIKQSNDYIFTYGKLRTDSFIIFTHQEFTALSDHHPICAYIKLTE